MMCDGTWGTGCERHNGEYHRCSRLLGHTDGRHPEVHKCLCGETHPAGGLVVT